MEDRLEKSIRIGVLTGTGRGLGANKPGSTSPDKARAALEEKHKDLWNELRAKHMNDEQLDALLEFYESDMGASILAALESIRLEFSSTFLEHLNTNPNAKDGTGGVGLSIPDNSDDDT